MEIEGKVYTIPLPDGATRFSNASYPEMDGLEQYLVINYEFHDEYYENIQNLPDYFFDQMGVALFLHSKDQKVQFEISMTNYARRYELLTVRYTTNQEEMLPFDAES